MRTTSARAPLTALTRNPQGALDALSEYELEPRPVGQVGAEEISTPRKIDPPDDRLAADSILDRDPEHASLAVRGDAPHHGRAKGTRVPTSKDASAVFRAENGELERLSALETLKGLKSRESVSLSEFVHFLQTRGLWSNFAKITLGDLRDAFAPPEVKAEEGTGRRRRKQRILEEEFGDLEPKAKSKPKPPDDGGMTTEEIVPIVMPFIEGNGEVTFDDLEEYSRLERKVLRYHLGKLVKEGRLERIGLGRNAVYSTL